MERIIDTAARFGVKIAVCINKFDINKENTEKLELFCKNHGLAFMGKIPFDSQAVKAVNSGKTIADIDCASGQAVKEVYNSVMELLFEEDGGLRS